MDLNHDMIYNELDNTLFVTHGTETYTLGIPTMRDFDMNNYELT